MLFSEWMDRNGIRPEGVVAEVERHGLVTSPDMVCRVRNRKRRFSPEINRIIVGWSKGEVTWEELNFPEEYRKAKK